MAYVVMTVEQRIKNNGARPMTIDSRIVWKTVSMSMLDSWLTEIGPRVCWKHTRTEPRRG